MFHSRPPPPTAPATAPAAVPTAAPTYTLDALARAGAALAQAGKMQEALLTARLNAAQTSNKGQETSFKLQGTKSG